MFNLYAPTYQAVKIAQALEATVLEGPEAADTQVKLAQMASQTYDAIRRAASTMPPPAGLSVKEAMAVNAAAVALALHSAHVDTGSKVASSPDHLASAVSKLATAVFVDEVLLEQLPMLEGDTKVAAEQCQRLGREYIVSLLNELLP